MYSISRELIRELYTRKVRFCHWKSNIFLDKALSGFDDLDILVDRRDFDTFVGVASSMGFKISRHDALSTEGVNHFYGLCKDNGEILHLHVYQVVTTGASWVKSITWNRTKYFLENSEYTSGLKMRTPIPELELVFFVLRIYLKHSLLSELILLSREKTRINKEIKWLKDRVDNKRLEVVLNELSLGFDYEKFNLWLDRLEVGSFLTRYFTHFTVRSALASFMRFSSINFTLRTLCSGVLRVVRRLFRTKGKKLITGGIIIAFVGSDGVGKSSLLGASSTWLSKYFTTTVLHFGKPTKLFNLRSKLRGSSKSDHGLSLLKDSERLSYAKLLKSCAIALYRVLILRKAFRRASRGEIVLLDRYKSENFGAMDSKKLQGDYYRGIKKHLSQFENRLYDNLPSPDLILRLHVDVEEAVLRNDARKKIGKEDSKFIRRRHELNKNLVYESNFQTSIDTSGSFSTVLLKVKKIIWTHL